MEDPAGTKAGNVSDITSVFWPVVVMNCVDTLLIRMDS